jgi:predicted dehydrogenase
MNVLIIGYGSIGAKHYEILSDLGCCVSVLSKRNINVDRSYVRLKDAINTENPKYIVIANKTSDHYSSLAELNELGFNGSILIEKPLFHEVLTITKSDNIYVGYNMRFNPLLQRLQKELKNQNIISAQAYVGQYLPHWRPNIDYRKSYSSSKSEGGGVLRDLSHELDYLNWLFGGWKSLSALGGNLSDLEIDSDDVFSLMIKMNNCPIVSLQLNYLDRVGRRNLLINTNNHVFQIDFINKTFQKDNEVEVFEYDRNYTYINQHKAIFENNSNFLCSIKDGSEILKLIQAAEHSAFADKNYWVENETDL